MRQVSRHNKPAHLASDSIQRFRIGDTKRLYAEIINFGATLIGLYSPDRRGRMANVVLQYNNIRDYLENPHYLGSTIGRLAGRTRAGKVVLNGSVYQLDTSRHTHHLHGGRAAISHCYWQCLKHSDNELILSLNDVWSPGKMPGDVAFTAHYRIDNQSLTIAYSATVSEATLINMTNHSYFNLSGQRQSVGAHRMNVLARRYYTVDDDHLPARKAPCRAPFDFYTPKTIQSALASDDVQIRRASGLDHPFVLEAKRPHAVSLVDFDSGRQLTVDSNQPAVVIYSGNYLATEQSPFVKHQGICFECQQVPNYMHIDDDVEIVLPETAYRHTTRYCLSVVT